jgi:hypothetical protein
MEAMAATEIASARGIEKRSDRSGAAATPVACWADRRVTAIPAEPRQQSGEAPNRKLAPAGGTARGSHNGKCGRQQPVDQPPASPEQVRARRDASRAAGLVWPGRLKLGGGESSHGTDSPGRVVCAEVSCYSGARKADEGERCPEGRPARPLPTIREFFTAIRVAREARTSNLDRSNLYKETNPCGFAWRLVC